MQVEQGKYGATKDVYFDLFEVDGVDLRTDWTPVAADCQVSVDGGAYSNSDNIAVVAPNASGTYKVVLSATEMTGKVAMIKLVDAATKVFLDKTIKVETYGHASALHVNYPADLTHVMGTILTETVSGRLAAAIIKLFDVVTPLLVASDVMRGTDSANTTVPDAAGTAPTAVEIRTEIDSNSTRLDADISSRSPASEYDTEMARITANVATEAKQDIIDGIVDQIVAVTDWQRACSGTVVVNNPGTDTIFDLTAVTGSLSTNNDSCVNMQITFFDVSGGIYETRKVSAFVGASGRVTLDTSLTFPVDDGVDTFILWNKYSPTAAAGGGATAQEVHEYDVSGITTEGQAGYEIQQSGGGNSIYS